MRSPRHIRTWLTLILFFLSTRSACALGETLNKVMLVEMSRAMMASTVAAISGRTDQVTSCRPASTPCGAHGPLRQSSTFADLEHQSLEGDHGLARWEGEVQSGHLGADTRLHEKLMAGLAISWSRSTITSTATDRTAGEYVGNLTSLHPYVGWTGPRGFGLWATAGYSWGDTELEKATLESQSSALKRWSIAVGGNRALFTFDRWTKGGATTGNIRVDFWLARTLTDEEKTYLLRGNQWVSVHRIRTTLQLAHEHPLASGGMFMPTVEVSGRYDHGTGLTTGSGIETAVALRYFNPLSGFTVESRARALHLHTGDVGDWGLNVLIRKDPGAAGRGLSLKLMPSLRGFLRRTEEPWSSLRRSQADHIATARGQC